MGGDSSAPATPRRPRERTDVDLLLMYGTHAVARGFINPAHRDLVPQGRRDEKRYWRVSFVNAGRSLNPVDTTYRRDDSARSWRIETPYVNGSPDSRRRLAPPLTTSTSNSARSYCGWSSSTSSSAVGGSKSSFASPWTSPHLHQIVDCPAKTVCVPSVSRIWAWWLKRSRNASVKRSLAERLGPFVTEKIGGDYADE